MIIGNNNPTNNSNFLKNNMKDENTIREIINDISNMTGKEVSKEKADKIVNAIKNDKVPKNLDKML